MYVYCSRLPMASRFSIQVTAAGSKMLGSMNNQLIISERYGGKVFGGAYGEQ